MRCVLACANKVITLCFYFILLIFRVGLLGSYAQKVYKYNLERLTLLSRALETAPKLSNVWLPLT